MSNRIQVPFPLKSVATIKHACDKQKYIFRDNRRCVQDYLSKSCLSNRCFLPFRLLQIFPSFSHLRSVRGLILSNCAASLRFRSGLSSSVCREMAAGETACCTLTSCMADFSFSSRFACLYAFLLQVWEQYRVSIVLAINSCWQCWQTLFSRILLLMI